MKDYKPILEKFFKNKLTQEELNELLFNLRKIVEKAEKILDERSTGGIKNALAKYYGSDYYKDLAYEVLLILIKEKNYITKLEFIHENYLISVAKNLILYRINSSEFKFLKKVEKFEELIKQPEFKEDENLKLEETLPKVEFDYPENLTLTHAVEVLKEKLSPTEIETLCWYVLTYIYNQEIKCKVNRNVLYKRWERLKPKLREILGFEFPEEVSPQKFFELIKSELCEKLNYIKNR
jgi:hypothetical protein